jgi:type IX secretion system PorP/SprF family membrane protein
LKITLKKINYFTLLIFLAILDKTIAQDAHFSQALNFPMLINPAYSGAFDGQTRALLSVRNQNLAVPNSAFSGVYNTFGASLDHKIFQDLTDQNTWSIGAMALSDYAGSGTLATNQLLIHSAYSLAMDRYSQSFISIGAQVGVTNRRLFSNDLLYASQVREFEFDPRLPNLEPFINEGSEYAFMFNLGALYQQQIGDNVVSQVGFSLYNINNPSQFFFTNSKENIYARMNISGGLLFKLDDFSQIYPSVIFMKQGNFSSTNIGMSYMYSLNDNITLIAGLRTRLNDAFIAVAGLKYNQFQATVSYDVTTSGLSKANNSIGALELNLSYILGKSTESYGNDKLYCPGI